MEYRRKGGHAGHQNQRRKNQNRTAPKRLVRTLGNLRLHARHQRRGNGSVGSRDQRVIDRKVQRLFFGERGRAKVAARNVLRRVSAQRFARCKGVHQRLAVGFTKHRSFSARVFLAKNSRDLTVPIGTASNSATSSSVCPSMAARKSTRRCFSGSSSSARSNWR